MLKATALLVPTPITIGFRTRILEAFRHGVAVIAHEANAVGMPELKHEHNALVSKKGKDFAGAILRLTNKPIDAITIGNNGFSDFSRQLNSDFVGSKILEFLDKEVL
jgi:glycosyltransferase involved in cell wall biosynthesis